MKWDTRYEMMWLAACLLAFCLLILSGCGKVARAQEGDSHVRPPVGPYLAAKLVVKRKDVLSRELEAAKVGKVGRGLSKWDVDRVVRRGKLMYLFRTQKCKHRRIERIEHMKRNDWALLPMLWVAQDATQKGMVGRLEYDDGTGPRDTIVVQVVDEANVILQQEGETFWVEGCSTDGMIDGRALGRGWISGAFMIEGTRRYTTAIGSTRTILLLQPFDLREALKSHGKPVRVASR